MTSGSLQFIHNESGDPNGGNIVRFQGRRVVTVRHQCRLRSLRENPLWSIDGIIRESPVTLDSNGVFANRPINYVDVSYKFKGPNLHWCVWTAGMLCNHVYISSLAIVQTIYTYFVMNITVLVNSIVHMKYGYFFIFNYLHCSNRR